MEIHDFTMYVLIYQLKKHLKEIGARCCRDQRSANRAS